MAKSVHTDVLNALLDYIANNCIRVTVCSTQPTTYTEGNATFKLATKTVTAGAGNGSFTEAAGDVSGRKLTLLQQANIPVDSSGTALHIAFLDVANSKLLAVTTCTSQALTAGNTVTIPAFKIEVSDPA